MEAEFRLVPGVVGTAAGYSGGHTKNPSYSDVCSGDTGHAETVLVEFDPRRVRYEELLAVFWNLHDPTIPNETGPSHGDQYRSAIFVYSAAQKAAALASRDALERSGEIGHRRVTTEITEATGLWPAESYHQQYVEKGGFASCRLRKPRPVL